MNPILSENKFDLDLVRVPSLTGDVLINYFYTWAQENMLLSA